MHWLLNLVYVFTCQRARARSHSHMHILAYTHPHALELDKYRRVNIRRHSVLSKLSVLWLYPSLYVGILCCPNCLYCGCTPLNVSPPPQLTHLVPQFLFHPLHPRIIFLQQSLHPGGEGSGCRWRCEHFLWLRLELVPTQCYHAWVTIVANW